MTEVADAQPAQVRRHRGPSAVWILPLLAALIAGWLVYKNYREAGIAVEVVFDSAEGLEVNKTKLLYKGLPGGTLTALRLNEDLRTVTATIEVAPEAEQLLSASTEFWLVKPQVSLSGVRGLETLLSGYYIGVRPGEGPPARHFRALREPPPPDKDDEGLYVTLFAASAESINRGSRIYFRHIDVGEVVDYRLSDTGGDILIDLYIEPRYAHLVKKNSRFWNASGIQVKADLPQVDVRFGSLASIIAGGIHFYNAPFESPPAVSGDQFRLYADFEAAEDGIEVALTFPGTAALSEGTDVISRGIRIGRVRDLRLSDDYSELRAKLLIDPRARDLLRAGSRFWLEKPELTLDGLGDWRTLVKGSHIELEPGTGQEQFRFEALEMAPARPPVYSGLPIDLVTERLGSVSRGSPILYRQLPVGQVTGYELIDKGERVLIHAVIDEQYRGLVASHSRFWNSSGIRFAASLEGVEVDSESLRSLVAGGISFFTPDIRDPRPAAPDQRFELHDDFGDASQQGRLLYAERADKKVVRLHADTLGSLGVGSPVLYKQLPVGTVNNYRLAEDGDGIDIELLIDKPYRHLVTSTSRFWNASGVSLQFHPQQGLKLNTGSLSSLVAGGVAFETPAGGETVPVSHRFTLYADRTTSIEQGLEIRILFPPDQELEAGAPIRYRGVTVGRIEDVRLYDAKGTLDARAVLFREGHFLARKGSWFWITRPEVRLSEIRHPANLIFGNYVEVSPGPDNAEPSRYFIAASDAPQDYYGNGLNLVLSSRQLGSLEKGSRVFYRQVPVGEVTGFRLSGDGQTVEVFAHIRAEHAHLVRSGSQFWNISGFQADFSLFKGLKLDGATLESLVGGGIAFRSPPEGGRVANGSHFELHEREPEAAAQTAREDEPAT
ncbi:paraquat-inducible protein B [Marinobacterium nitratireducens]|uniref:Paraquat-inducible protein B n=1 Tax=Marinobacterium nitratireducens TaxID=518897 RepID=A0A917ZPE6_9GAMM|nr:MlaD family protein [Marinobacterium nitratireducens]GGO86842.1 paraquat-inducible protein B [Marinobacterium nitratireducens]